MIKYPDFISKKRSPAPTPDSIIENGKTNFGTFDAPFKNLNLIEAQDAWSKALSVKARASRLTQWEAFEVHFDEGALISAVYNLGTAIGFSIFVWYDKINNKIYSWKNFVVPAKKAKVASQLINDYCYLKTGKSEYRIDNDFANGKASAKGYTKGKNGSFEIDVKFERLSPLANGVMPLAQKDGKFVNPLYSEKDFFKATGTITLNGKTFTSNERSVGIIDDHKGYYPRPAHYDWLTTMGQCEIDGKMQYLAFNLTRNQSVDQDNYNENVLWLEGKSYPLPPVWFTHKDDKKKADVWYIKDEHGMVDLRFEIAQTFYMPIPVITYYALPYGKIYGTIKDHDGKVYVLDNMIGIGEDKTTRT